MPPVSGLCRRRAWTAGSGSETASAWRRTARFPFCPGTSFRSRGTPIHGVRASSGDGRGSTDIRKKLARPLSEVEDVFAKRHTDDSFRKFRDRPQGKVAISTCARPRNSTDIARKFYRVLEPGTLLVILFLFFIGGGSEIGGSARRNHHSPWHLADSPNYSMVWSSLTRDNCIVS